MPELSKDLIGLLTYLLPGFLAAWVFYGLTSHTKPSQFERVVQALIFTLVIQALVPIAEWSLQVVGRHLSFSPGSKITEMISSIGIASLFGALLAYFANTDKLHKKLRDIGFSTRTSYPSEWFGVLSQKMTYVILQLKDNRRLYGWPKEWPTNSDGGFFYIMYPSWVAKDGTLLNLKALDGLLINVDDVRWVEFLSSPKG